MKPFSVFMIIAAALTFLVDVRCAQKAEWRGKIEIIDGLPFIHNPKEPIYGSAVLSLEDPLRIGQAAGKEEYMFQEIGAIEVDDQERIYVSDWKESRVKIFDKNGGYMKTVGRRGQGPGEFERINRLQILDESKIVVFDGNLKRLSFFSLDGDFEKSVPVQKMSPLDVRLCSNGFFLVETVQLNPVSAKADVAIKLFDPEFKVVKVLATQKSQDVLTPFQPYLVWALFGNNNILLGSNEKYSFSLYDPLGKVLKTIAREYQPIRVPEEEKKARLKQLQQPSNKEVPAYYPAYQGIAIDRDRRIIVQTWEKPKSSAGLYYDVFDIEGKFLARIILKYPPRLWKRNRLYTIEEDEAGLPQVVRYTAVWKM